MSVPQDLLVAKLLRRSIRSNFQPSGTPLTKLEGFTFTVAGKDPRKTALAWRLQDAAAGIEEMLILPKGSCASVSGGIHRRKNPGPLKEKGLSPYPGNWRTAA